MKRYARPFALAFFVLISAFVSAQDSYVKTVFRGSKSSGGYGALTNKFTNIRGEYANISGVYGGWYVNHWFMLGIGAAAVTNNIPVPLQYSVDPSTDLSYEYGQVGLVTEYVVGSNKVVHVAFNLFSGAGFTVQYQRYGGIDNHSYDIQGIHDENWFFVAEPGVQVELNLFKWMRFSPGVSYRATYGSNSQGLTDNDLSNMTYNVTLKFGKF